MASAGRPKRVLIIVENLPVPFDRRVRQECRTLRDAGYTVSVICPVGKGYESRYENREGIHIYRHSLPLEARGALGYALEYVTALFWEFVLTWKVLRKHGFDVIHACNPRDTIFLIGGFFKLFGKRFLLDHRDINPDVANEMNDKSTMNKIMEYMALGKPAVQFDLTEGKFTAREAPRLLAAYAALWQKEADMGDTTAGDDSGQLPAAQRAGDPDNRMVTQRVSQRIQSCGARWFC